MSLEEESGHAVLQDFSAWTEQRRRGIKLAPERQHVIFIAACSMQKQKDTRWWDRFRGNKAVREIHIGDVRHTLC